MVVVCVFDSRNCLTESNKALTEITSALAFLHQDFRVEFKTHPQTQGHWGFLLFSSRSFVICAWHSGMIICERRSVYVQVHFWKYGCPSSSKPICCQEHPLPVESKMSPELCKTSCPWWLQALHSLCFLFWYPRDTGVPPFEIPAAPYNVFWFFLSFPDPLHVNFESFLFANLTFRLTDCFWCFPVYWQKHTSFLSWYF